MGDGLRDGCLDEHIPRMLESPFLCVLAALREINWLRIFGTGNRTLNA